MDLAALTGGARAALGDDLLGLYLVGARALGADEQRGLAFVAVTAERLTPGPLAALEGLHTRLPDVAGTYAPAADLRSPMTVGRAWPCVDHGSRELVVSGHANTLAARWVLRERGVPVLGPRTSRSTPSAWPTGRTAPTSS